jgi:hypothetical protein
MQDPHDPFAPAAAPPRQASKALWWVFAAMGAAVLVCCGGVVAVVGYVGVVSPETSVYAGNQLPQKFLDTASEVGALEPGEQVRFFYSDGLVNIREGFYFVSDRKVAIYVEDGRAEPLTVIEFDNISSVDLQRDESFFEDSQITIETEDGQYLVFPVSSEFDRDVEFFEAIKQKVASNEKRGQDS